VDYVVLIVLVIGLGLAWWWLSRRRRQLLPDDDEPASTGPGHPGPPEVYTRDALVNRSRQFDPGAWDDSADDATPTPAAEDGADTPPAYLDRDYLERRNPPAATPSEEVPPVTTPPVAAPPVTTPAAAAAPLPPWPTTPTETDEEADLPRYFDREYLERKARRNESDPPGPDA